MRIAPRSKWTAALGGVCLAALGIAVAHAAERDGPAARKKAGTAPATKQKEAVQRYMDRIFDPKKCEYACVATTPAEFAVWQARARRALIDLLKIDVIREDARGAKPTAKMAPKIEDLGAFTRQEGTLETEPGVDIHFWILKPRGPGPFPLCITANGHGPSRGAAGIYLSEAEKKRVLDEDRDIGIQAVSRGYLAIVTATRGISQDPEAFGIADIDNRNAGKDCAAHNWHAIAAGRTMMGERVWDIMRFLDWALALKESDRNTVTMTGNSGGGMLTYYAAAVDERISIAIPSSSFDNFFQPQGNLTHCQCNHFPGMTRFGQFWDIAGLIAPRPLLTVTGLHDSLHPVEEVRHAAAQVKRIYTAAGVPDRYEHQFGPAGHRFYKDIQWAFVAKTLGKDR